MASAPGSTEAERDAAPASPAELYERDFFAWTKDQSERLRRLRPAGLDWKNVAEEIESVGRSQKTEIRNRMIKLLSHLLKWEFQPERRSHSWQSTIGEQRTHIAGLIEDSPSLGRFPSEIIARAFSAARREAARETRLPIDRFPDACPYTAAEVIDYAFMPGRPWVPSDLSRD